MEQLQLLSKKEAAKYLCISTDTLMAEHAAGRVVGFKIARNWKFDRRDLDSYVGRKRDEATVLASAKQQRRAIGKKVLQMRPNAAAGPPLDHVWTPGKRIQDVCAARMK